MKLETIYNDLIDIMKHDMNFTKALKLKEKLENAIRLETCYKATSKTRVNAIKRVASKWEDRPALTGYGIKDGYKYVTDSYHAIKIKEDNMPLKLATTDSELANKVGKENCINATYPDLDKIMQFDKSKYKAIKLDYNDIEQFYKLHKKNAKDELYQIENKFYNIIFIKNVIDVLGTDTTAYIIEDEIRPMFIENKENELGIILPVKKY